MAANPCCWDGRAQRDSWRQAPLTGPAPVLESRDKPGLVQRPHAPELVNGDDHRFLGVSVADEADQTVIACIGVFHDARVAIDFERPALREMFHAHDPRNPL
jgi:hypothetical protein